MPPRPKANWTNVQTKALYAFVKKCAPRGVGDRDGLIQDVVLRVSLECDPTDAVTWQNKARRWSENSGSNEKKRAGRRAATDQIIAGEVDGSHKDAISARGSESETAWVGTGTKAHSRVRVRNFHQKSPGGPLVPGDAATYAGANDKTGGANAWCVELGPGVPVDDKVATLIEWLLVQLPVHGFPAVRIGVNIQIEHLQRLQRMFVAAYGCTFDDFPWVNLGNRLIGAITEAHMRAPSKEPLTAKEILDRHRDRFLSVLGPNNISEKDVAGLVVRSHLNRGGGRGRKRTKSVPRIVADFLNVFRRAKGLANLRAE